MRVLENSLFPDFISDRFLANNVAEKSMLFQSMRTQNTKTNTKSKEKAQTQSANNNAKTFEKSGNKIVERKESRRKILICFVRAMYERRNKMKMKREGHWNGNSRSRFLFSAYKKF